MYTYTSAKDQRSQRSLKIFVPLMSDFLIVVLSTRHQENMSM